jgi:putative nucleotidyltransferase with HDIG domain
MTTPNDKAERITRITRGIINLPTLPRVVSKMIELVDNPKTSAGSLARLISNDQVLTARVLKLANSAYYGFPREIYSVDMAIVVLGFNAVKEIGLSLSVLDTFRDTESNAYFDVSRFWEHSLGCGVGAKALAKRYAPGYASHVFVAGLMHDIGKIIISLYAKKDFLEIARSVWETNEPWSHAEERVLGIDHAHIGGILAERWKFPEIIVNCIRNHHTPWDAPEPRTPPALVSLANSLCHACNIGNISPTTVDDADTRLWQVFEEQNIPMDEATVDDLREEILIAYDQSQPFMNAVSE